MDQYFEQPSQDLIMGKNPDLIGGNIESKEYRLTEYGVSVEQFTRKLLMATVGDFYPPSRLKVQEGDNPDARWTFSDKTVTLTTNKCAENQPEARWDDEVRFEDGTYPRWFMDAWKLAHELGHAWFDERVFQKPNLDSTAIRTSLADVLHEMYGVITEDVFFSSLLHLDDSTKSILKINNKMIEDISGSRIKGLEASQSVIGTHGAAMMALETIMGHKLDLESLHNLESLKNTYSGLNMALTTFSPSDFEGLNMKLISDFSPEQCVGKIVSALKI
jgi:hypothetical protein